MKSKFYRFVRLFLSDKLIYTLIIVMMHEMVSAKNLVEKNNWAYLADTVMGGVSQGSAEFSSGALRLSGQVSTENNGGFIQVRTRVNSSEADGKIGIKVKVKGNGDIYYLHVRNNSARLPWHYYTVDFKTSKKWQEIQSPFESFE